MLSSTVQSETFFNFVFGEDVQEPLTIAETRTFVSSGDIVIPSGNCRLGENLHFMWKKRVTVALINVCEGLWSCTGLET